MMKINPAWVKYLFLLPLAIMITFTLFFSNMTKAYEKSLLDEKFEEKKLTVAAIANHTDAFIKLDDDWVEEHEYYKQSLIFDMEVLDTAYMTYAVVFDENLRQVSEQHNYSGGFDPMIYPRFKNEVHENDIGDTIIHYKPVIGIERDVYVHYRWIPTGREFNDKFLVVIAISKQTITTQIAAWIKVGSIVLITVTTLLNIAMVLVICRLRLKNPDKHSQEQFQL